MANSAGGAIIYGIDEQRKSNGPIQLDNGVDPITVTPEWLEQVIDSSIQQRIDGIQIRPIKMGNAGNFVYLIWIPQSNRAPHMARDHRYYKRLGTTTAMMEEYEVRDVSHRSESPDLYLDLTVTPMGIPGVLRLDPRIVNRATEPALYATCRLYVGPGLTIRGDYSNSAWDTLADAEMLWNHSDRITFHVHRNSWSVPSRHPILEGELYKLGDLYLTVGSDYRVWSQSRRYYLGWEIRTPKTPPHLRGFALTVDQTGPHIETPSYALAPL
jgi:hypothetical protein